MTIDAARERNLTIRNMTGEKEAFVQCPEASENAIFCAYLNSTLWEEVRLSIRCTQRKKILLIKKV